MTRESDVSDVILAYSCEIKVRMSRHLHRVAQKASEKESLSPHNASPARSIAWTGPALSRFVVLTSGDRIAVRNGEQFWG